MDQRKSCKKRYSLPRIELIANAFRHRESSDVI
jgi:hypothetical protein